MRGWIILECLIAVAGVVSMVSGRSPLNSAVCLTVLGFVLLGLTVSARIVRGRA